MEDMIKKSGAIWSHDGKAKRPHVVLTGGRHSGGYFNGRVVEENPILLDLVAFEMVARTEEAGVNIREIDRVVGPAMGAIELAHSVARNIHRVRGKLCLSSYTEKEQDKMVFCTSYVLPGENVLIV